VAAKQGTAGGVTITQATVNTGGGDIVGRDKIGYTSLNQIEGAFRPVAQAIEVADLDRKAAAAEKLRALKEEVAKGANANDSVIAKLVDGLVGLVPGAVSAIAATFAGPLLSGITGPVTKFVLDKIQGK
jgi:hypothetical protein